MIEWVIPGRLARSPRPGYPEQGGRRVDPAEVEAWLGEAKALGIRSILCLLDPEQLNEYRHLPGGLLETYRRAGMGVGHVPVEDHQTPPIPADRLEEVERLFATLPQPLLVHCSAGIDRNEVMLDHDIARLQRGQRRTEAVVLAADVPLLVQQMDEDRHGRRDALVDAPVGEHVERLTGRGAFGSYLISDE